MQGIVDLHIEAKHGTSSFEEERDWPKVNNKLLRIF